MPNEIDDAAEEFGLDKKMMHTFARIESDHKPYARTGSYKGLFQLSDSEFMRWGGGNIYNARDNSRAAARKIKFESGQLENKLGRPPTATEIYLTHQQGTAGFAAHSSNPNAPAWQNMASTGEGRQKGQAWSKRAIWGNIPDSDKRRFGSVENVSSQDLMDVWHRRVEGTGAPASVSSKEASESLWHERPGLPEQAGEGIRQYTYDEDGGGGRERGGAVDGESEETPTKTVYGPRTRITVDKPQRSLASREPDYVPTYQSPFTASDVAAMPVPTAPEIRIGRLKAPDYG